VAQLPDSQPNQRAHSYGDGHPRQFSTPVSLTLQITVSQHGSLAAITAPGAACSARAQLPSGTYSSAQGLLAQPVADGAGNVSWSYGTTTRTAKGTGTHFVSCTLGAQSVTSQASFAV